MPVWDGNRGRQNCDGSRAQNADRLLIRPASGRQAGTGLSARTNHWKDTRTAESFENRVTNKEHRHQPDKRPRRDNSHTHSSEMSPDGEGLNDELRTREEVQTFGPRSPTRDIEGGAKWLNGRSRSELSI